MSWESPIEMIIEDIDQKMTDGVMQMIQKVHVNVNKDELIKALQYDRQQYIKGYCDGINDSKIIRCKECKHRKNYSVCPLLCDDSFYNEDYGDDFFCAFGERITDE